ncbi:MAG TPA: DUF2203 domain-containing protein [Gaiellaceae bacterium]|nr:DUF2203 domain-containing protein [Gaiellaceae bacterium]
MPPRFFTVQQASDALDTVRPLAERLVERRRALRELERRRGEIAAAVAGNGGGVDPQAVARLDAGIRDELRAVAQCVNGIHGAGAVVKDPDTGLIDFPALRQGEEVCLCWRVGEDAIEYWHGLEEGFAGRKPLPLE